MMNGKKKGTVYAWAVILAMGWIVTILWIIFTTITVETFYPWASDRIDNAEAQAVLDRQVDYHNFWPMFLMAGLTVYGLVSSAKREPTDAYYSA